MSTLSFKKLKGQGIRSPTCFSSPEKSIEDANILAGVPVFNLLIRKADFFREAAKPIDAFSFMRPAGNDFRPHGGVRFGDRFMKDSQVTDMNFAREECTSADNDFSTGNQLASLCAVWLSNKHEPAPRGVILL